MAHMNGFADHGLDESAFGEKASLGSGLRTFDAFRESLLAQLAFFLYSIFPRSLCLLHYGGPVL